MLLSLHVKRIVLFLPHVQIKGARHPPHERYTILKHGTGFSGMKLTLLFVLALAPLGQSANPE